MTTTRFPSRAGWTIALTWFAVATVAVMGVLYLLGWSLRPAYAIGVVAVAVIAVGLLNRGDTR